MHVRAFSPPRGARDFYTFVSDVDNKLYRRNARIVIESCNLPIVPRGKDPTISVRQEVTGCLFGVLSTFSRYNYLGVELTCENGRFPDLEPGDPRTPTLLQDDLKHICAAYGLHGRFATRISAAGYQERKYFAALCTRETKPNLFRQKLDLGASC